jgi:1-acyl-sn-glycerol-3-phosphate acyltransferase
VHGARPYDQLVTRRAIDAVLAVVARVAVRLATRRVEVIDGDRIPTDRPVLVVANHFNGFVDPLVVVTVLRRLPRFLAKSTLWKVLPLRPLLRLAGIIPVHRRVDGGGGEANVGTFAAAEQALRRRQTVAIFPEGITHDDPRLATIRTGAARIALGALAAGAEGLTIVPIGLLFEDKVAIRTRVLARVGEPIDLAATLPSLVDAVPADGAVVDEEDRGAVRRLTDLLTDRLREVTPDYDDRWQHAELGLAADVALRPEPRARPEPVPLVDREVTAQRLARSPVVEDVRDATQRYATRLHLVDADDGDLLAHGGVIGWARRLLAVGIGLATVAVLLAPALVWSAVPVLVVILVGSQTVSPVTKGTVRLLTGIVLLLATWITVAVVVADTALLRIAWFLYQVVALRVAVPIIEYALEWVRSTRSWWHLRQHRARVPELLADRAALVDAVTSAVRVRS